MIRLNVEGATALAVCAMLLTSCTEVTSDGLIGQIDHGQFVSGEDTVLIDAAGALEGIWVGGLESEPQNVYLLRHVGAGSLKVWTPEWEGGDFRLSSTLAITSELGGSQYLNVARKDGSGPSRFWNFRYVLNDELLRVHVIDEMFLKWAHQDGRITTLDSVDSHHVNLRAGELSTLVADFDWEPWIVDEVMIFRQIARELPD